MFYLINYMIIFTSSIPVTDISNVTFDISNGDLGSEQYVVSILTNSMYKCNLSIDISSIVGPLYNIITPNYFTNHTVCNYAKQLYDIPHIFTLPDGKYTLNMSASQPVHMYELQIKMYNPSNKINLGYQPLITNNIPINECSYNKYFIIPNMAADYGGLWWCIYIAVVGVHIAVENNLIPIIEYNGGLYGSNSIYDPDNLPSSWLDYFYEDPYPINTEEKKRVLEYSNSNRSFIRLHPRRNTIQLIPESKCHLYHRRIFTQLSRKLRLNMRNIVKKYLRPLPYIREYCDEFWNTHNPNNLPIIGIHYRGTDKYPTSTANESFPIHYSYESVASIVREKLSELMIDKFLLYCSTDEQPFIEYMKTQFDCVVVNTHSMRSSVSTSGIKYVFNNIEFGHTTDVVQRANYDYIKSISTHFGNKDKSNYIKGFYALTDCALFKPCSVIFISQGNFSEFAMYHTDEDTKVYNLNDLYKPYLDTLIVR